MRADTETKVIQILEGAGYWSDPRAWRLFSDSENNYSSIGNQQADAVAAFVEKIINSVDARLVNACRQAGIDPEGPDAPDSMRTAVARFFEQKANPKDSDGRIADWPDKKATEEGRLLTVAATGLMPRDGWPSLTVADQGEGQTPDDFPNTFLSLQRSNKLRIPFVQGKFNMGGTGALRFSKLQLVVSRRNPTLLPSDASERDRQWGFTIVRREPPTGGAKSSVYKYLAPVDIDGSSLRGVLSFATEELAIFPETTSTIRDAYYRNSPYGSLVKLYEYNWTGVKSNIVMSGDGLLRRIDVGLPELALPVRVFECRPGYKGHAGSFATNALGLVARLDRDKYDNLEGGEPIGGVIALEDGTQIKLRVYVFESKDKASQYRNRANGLVFGVNGQQHGAKSIDFFTRGKVNKSYLAESMLVYADCSQISGQAREDLFMNSRDRLSVNDLSRQLESKLESFLKNEGTLKDLQTERRMKAIQEKLAEDKPLNDVLQGLMKSNPLLSKLFLQGLSLSAPFPPGAGASGTGKGKGGKFVGKRYPTYFRFKDHKDGESLRRNTHMGSRTRVAFETDAEDSYFIRDHEPGEWKVCRKVDGEWVGAGGWTTTGPKSGIAHLTFDSLPDDAALGSVLDYRIDIIDPVQFDPFSVELTLDVVEASNGGGGAGGSGKRVNTGKGNTGDSTTLNLPNIVTVTRDKWGDEFNELSALKIKHVGSEEDSEAPVYDFYVNVDNKFLLHSQKESTGDSELLRKQFIYGFVLVGLALIQEHKRDERDESADEDEPIEAFVERTTRALAPILVPMIQTIGTLTED
jgi:hypothetical protein